jgi:hypothetical protein
MDGVSNDYLKNNGATEQDWETWKKIRNSPVWKPEFDNTMDEYMERNIGIWLKENKQAVIPPAELAELYLTTWVACLRFYALCM